MSEGKCISCGAKIPEGKVIQKCNKCLAKHPDFEYLKDVAENAVDLKNTTLRNGAGRFSIGARVKTMDGEEGKIVADAGDYYIVKVAGGNERMREADLELANGTLHNGTAEDLMSRSGRHFVKNSIRASLAEFKKKLNAASSKNEALKMIEGWKKDGSINEEEANSLIIYEDSF